MEPIRLPDSVGVMDFTIVTDRNIQNPINSDEVQLNDDALIDEEHEFTDTSTFSIVFSPSGKLIIHGVCVRNRNGIPDSNGEIGNSSDDDVFNKMGQVHGGVGMFYQDDYFDAWWSCYPGLDLGLGPEPSRRRFIIYDRARFEGVDENSRWSDYLQSLDVIYINPYTGTMINR
jgi:hypothetical protein